MPDTTTKTNNSDHNNSKRCRSKRKQKRKYVSGSDSSKSAIPRGLPSILVSCDPTRELKCRREFLEILRHDWEITTTTAVATTTTATSASCCSEPAVLPPKLTLNQELEQIKRQHNNNEETHDGPFTVYDTGCKGSVLIVCTGAKPMVVLPPRSSKDTNLADPHKRPKPNADQGTVVDDSTATSKLAVTTREFMERAAKDDDDHSPPDATPMALAPSTGTTTKQQPTRNETTTTVVKVAWNPVDAVKRIVAEMVKPTSTYPDSRFCSKITPLQIIILADLDRIAQAVEQLIIGQRYLKQYSSAASIEGATNVDKVTTTTFAIRIHRRLGSDHITRNDIITKIAPLVPSHWQAQLTNPEIIIWIEIIKTMAGVSILTIPIPNLTQLRERRCQEGESR